MIFYEGDCCNIFYLCGVNKKYKLINKSFLIVNLMRIFFFIKLMGKSIYGFEIINYVFINYILMFVFNIF